MSVCLFVILFYDGRAQMEDEGSYGNDDIRCFILSNLATARMANAHCVVCQVRHHFDFTDEQWSSMKSDASYRFSVFFFCLCRAPWPFSTGTR